MAALYAVPDETLTGIANAIRSKTGSDEQMTVAAMASAIEGIGGGLEVIQPPEQLQYASARDYLASCLDGHSDCALVCPSVMFKGGSGKRYAFCFVKWINNSFETYSVKNGYEDNNLQVELAFGHKIKDIIYPENTIYVIPL